MSSQTASKPAQPGFKAEVIHVPNVLRAKVGGSFGGIDPAAIAKAEAALKALSSNFDSWLQDEVGKLEAARTAIRAQGMNAETAAQLYVHVHDLKGLGSTYGFPLIGRIAASLCNLMGRPEAHTAAPLVLVDAHIDAIRAAVRDGIRDSEHPVGRVLAEELERRTADYVKASTGSSIRP